jgi:hypothetical protein
LPTVLGAAAIDAAAIARPSKTTTKRRDTSITLVTPLC